MGVFEYLDQSPAYVGMRTVNHFQEILFCGLQPGDFRGVLATDFLYIRSGNAHQFLLTAAVFDKKG